MDSRRQRRQLRLLAWFSSLLLLLGPVALATAASAAPAAPPTPPHPVKATPGAGAASAESGKPNHPAKPAHPTPPAHSQGSTVSLPRPNDFQAQADPDGMTNGGVDQPGSTGGVDLTDQDGNNGSGNDADCEDDNRGVGVPGHCKDRTHAPAEGTPGVAATGLDDATVLVPEIRGPAMPGLGLVTDVSAPGGSSSVVTRGRAAASAPHALLPNTGASAGLTTAALAGVAALVAGGALVAGRRRTAH